MLAVNDLEIEFGLTGSVGHQRCDVVDNTVVDSFAVDGDGETLNGIIADGLQILHIVYTHIDILAVGISLRELAAHEDRAALHEHAAPLSPFLTEERQLARAFEVLDVHNAHRLAGLGVTVFHTSDYAAKNHFLFLQEFFLVIKFVAMGVAQVLQYDTEIVERMS